MDWVQLMAAFSAGVTGLYTLQRLIGNVQKAPPDKVIQNGERRSILSQLVRLEQLGLDQEQALARIEGRMADLDERLRVVERASARWRDRST